MHAVRWGDGGSMRRHNRSNALRTTASALVAALLTTLSLPVLFAAVTAAPAAAATCGFPPPPGTPGSSYTVPASGVSQGVVPVHGQAGRPPFVAPGNPSGGLGSGIAAVPDGAPGRVVDAG